MSLAHAQQLAFLDLDAQQHTVSESAPRGVAERSALPTAVTAGPEPDVTDYDLIVAGLSGRDAHAMLYVLTSQARRAGVFDRLFIGWTIGHISCLGQGDGWRVVRAGIRHPTCDRPTGHAGLLMSARLK